jgi:phosphatidate cytidylyltransferase
MKERLITSVVIIAVLAVIGLIDNRYLTGLLIGAIAIIGYKEAEKLFGVESVDVFYAAISTVAVGVFINPLAAAVFGVIGVLSYIAYFQKDLKLVLSILYPVVPLLILFDLYIKHSMGMIGWLIVIVALTDSFAYLVGKKFAKTFFKNGFCPTSPNKSWEGVIGGVGIGTVIGALIGLYFTGFWVALVVSLFVSVSSVFGDLFESYLKRRAGVKDSGNLLPGHGGILDRIDGYLFAAPAMWALLGS